ncbi:MAG: nuclear transport factor 2 family protein [Acidimicrobiia bacterium]
MATRLLVGHIDAWNAHDLDRLMALFADDCVFDASGGSSVHGQRFEGRGAVRDAARSRSRCFAQIVSAWSTTTTIPQCYACWRNGTVIWHSCGTNTAVVSTPCYSSSRREESRHRSVLPTLPGSSTVSILPMKRSGIGSSSPRN